MLLHYGMKNWYLILNDLKKIKAIRKFLSYPMVRRSIRFAKTTSFAGFSGVPLYDIIVFVVQEVQRDDILTRANSVAYSFFLALFPALIFMITILPFVPVEGIVDNIKIYLDTIMPSDAEGFLFDTLDDLTTIPRGGTLSLGAILALFFSSNGVLELMNGFDKTYSITFKKRGFVKKRLLALSLTVLLGFLLIVSAVLIVLGNLILSYVFDIFEMDRVSRIAFASVKWFAVIILIYSVISAIYRFGPALRRRSSFFSPGTTIAAIFTILISVAFSFFVNNFGTYNKIYGSIGAIIVLMIWLQIIALILLIGFELNAAIAVQRDLKQQREEKPPLW